MDGLVVNKRPHLFCVSWASGIVVGALEYDGADRSPELDQVLKYRYKYASVLVMYNMGVVGFGVGTGRNSK